MENSGRMVSNLEIKERRQQSAGLKPLNNCNSCNVRKCNGLVAKNKRGQRTHALNSGLYCPGHKSTSGKFKLFELALEHPQGINDTFNQLEGIDLNLIRIKRRR